jgi:hypothetical protein
MRDSDSVRRMKLPGPVAAIYKAVADLEAMYPGRKFTPDGHLVGSIGEVVAAEALRLILYPNCILVTMPTTERATFKSK